MKLRLAVTVLVALFALVGSAQADQPMYLHWNEAKAVTRGFAHVRCTKNQKCTESDAGGCARFNDTTYDCVAELILGAEERKCDIKTRWTLVSLDPRQIKLTSHGKTECSKA